MTSPDNIKIVHILNESYLLVFFVHIYIYLVTYLYRFSIFYDSYFSSDETQVTSERSRKRNKFVKFYFSTPFFLVIFKITDTFPKYDVHSIDNNIGVFRTLPLQRKEINGKDSQ